jgi:ribosomal 50S subunit-recycling heat shock protein
MTAYRTVITAACLTAALGLTGTALAQASAAGPKGEAVVASITLTATVTSINQATREVTIKAEDGQERSFVAGDEVKNLAQVKVGDVVTVDYAEELAYEVRKGGKAVDVAGAAAVGAAQPGAKPAGVVARQVTVTVLITAIDPKAPSVTFQGPRGNSRTIKVMRPEKLEGVSVGDTVEITYTEALAIRVEAAPKK